MRAYETYARCGPGKMKQSYHPPEIKKSDTCLFNTYLDRWRFNRVHYFLESVQREVKDWWRPNLKEYT